MSNSPFEPKWPEYPWLSLPVNPKPIGSSLSDLLSALQPKPSPLQQLLQRERPRIFVSYQHSSDQVYYDGFSSTFHDGYESIYDNSLRGRIRSDNPEYVIQRIRDEFITGTSCTIVLIGPTTYQRKYVDWEIKATFDKEHGIIGIQLPNVVADFNGKVLVPIRLNANINSGYANWIHWNVLVLLC